MIGTITYGSNPFYNTGAITCDAESWKCQDWMEWHGLLYIQYGADAHHRWCQAWNDEKNNITSLCWRSYYCTKDSGFLEYLSDHGILFNGMVAYIYNTLPEKDLIKQILLDDEITYLNIIKMYLYIESIPAPLLIPPLLDYVDALSAEVNALADQYNNRQIWLRENSDGNYSILDGDWSGSQYDMGIGVGPLLIIAIVAGAGIAIGGTAVYLLTTTSEEAAMNKIESSDAWNDLCAYDPAKCQELEKIIEKEMTKVKRRGKAEASFSGLSIFSYSLLAGLGLFWWKQSNQ